MDLSGVLDHSLSLHQTHVYTMLLLLKHSLLYAYRLRKIFPQVIVTQEADLTTSNQKRTFGMLSRTFGISGEMPNGTF